MNRTDFCRAIRSATKAPADFKVFLFGPLSDGLVQDMVSNLPPLAAYYPMPHPDSLVDQKPTRFAFTLSQTGVFLPPFWLGVAKVLHSDAVRNAVAAALGLSPDLMHSSAALVRDLPGYKIGIHPDTRHKLATVQVYLASDNRAPHLGARFHRKEPSGEFVETGGVPYLPGSGYFFRRSDTSWHSVNATQESDGARNSIMLIYFDSPGIGFK